jgi:hypothetical protein
MLEELHKLGIPVMVFDWQKNFRNIVTTRWGRQYRIFTVGRAISPFFLNPWIPPVGVEYATWLDRVLDLIGDSFYTGHGVHSLFKEIILKAFAERNIDVNNKYDGKQEGIPSMPDVTHRIMEYLPKRGESKADWKASSTRVVKGLSSGVAANIFCISGRVPVEKLFTQNVIFELKALSGDTKKFFINWFLNYLTEYWDARESRKEELNHVVMIDEAHHILMKRVMNLKSQDISVATKALSLEYQKWPFITWLKEGEAIARLQFRHPHPFLVKFKLIDIDKAAVTDADLEARKKGVASKDSNIDISEAFDEGIRQLSSLGEEKEENLSGPEALILMNVASKPMLGRLERYAELGLHTRTGGLTIRSLIERGLVAKRWLWDGAPRKDVLGWAARSQKANESIEHSYVKNNVAEFLKRNGWLASVEKRVGGHYPDVQAEKGGFRLAVEVEKGESEYWNNILKNLEVGFDLVVSLPLRRGLQAKIARKAATLPPEEQAKVKVMIQKEFYAWLPEFNPRPSAA